LQFFNLPRQKLSGGLFFAKNAGEFSQAQVQVFDGAVAIAEAGVEFAFPQGENVGAQLQTLLIQFSESCAVALFEQCAALAFLEGLHPEGFGDVGDGFWEAVQGGRARVQSRGKGFPPSVEQGIDGVG
jgi:hypothetical protein